MSKKVNKTPAKKRSIRTRTRVGTANARDYRHADREALLRPESGAQGMFPSGKIKSEKTYRYDSSLAPELAYDEDITRGKAERALAEILDADSLEQAKSAATALKKLSRASLNWAGKAERESFDVPTLPLFIHERLSTDAVLKTLKRNFRTRGETLDLFGESDKTVGEKIRGAYEHKNGWQNRLILGDSLQVMNSLLEYESLGRQVQMVYMDPPYGIKFGGNFQPFVRKRDVKDGSDEHMMREPETVKAYRDTWTLGIHSWLTYMRDRLLLSRKLLTDSGSCFVQISDANVHLLRCVMDEVFGRENFVSLITFRKTSAQTASLLPSVADYIVWYAKDISRVKFHQLYEIRDFDADEHYSRVQMPDGKIIPLAKDKDRVGKLMRMDQLASQTGTESSRQPFEFEGKKYTPPGSRGWTTSEKGLHRLVDAGRVIATGENISYIRYASDLPVRPIDSVWSEIFGVQSRADPKVYVVQTATSVVQRCMLMTTNAGDLVLDPTCGSGTTAVTAEQWGRRWITTDVSRVPLSLARQRLLTATYAYYKLKGESPSAGFVYERKQNRKGEEVGGIVPHVTLKSIANNEPSAEEVLVDKPEKESGTMRITGPFCVEAVMPTPLSPGCEGDAQDKAQDNLQGKADDVEYIARMVKILQQSPVLRWPGNKQVRLKNTRRTATSLGVHAEATLIEDGAQEEKLIGIAFGPQYGAISEHAVIEAVKVAKARNHSLLLFIGFAIEPDARDTIKQSQQDFELPAIALHATPDLFMGDLLKNSRDSQLFAAVGDPDIDLTKTDKKSDGHDLWQVKLNGLDSFDPVTMEPLSLKGDDVPCWMLDTDYDDQCFRAGQVFFPRTHEWDKIRNALRGEYDDAVWERLSSDTSEPFIAGKKIAVKVIDDRGNELMAIMRVEG